jgi:hypothetical protein
MIRPRLIAGVAVCCALVLVAVGQAQNGLSGEDAVALINHDAKNLQDLFAKKLDPKRKAKVKMAAFMIALYAQDAGMGELRDKALEVVKAIDKDPAKAKALAGDLKAGKGGDKVKAMAPAKELNLETLMKMYSGERVGGFAIEAALDNLADLKGALSGDEKDKALLLANKINAISSILAHYTPEKDDGPKTKKAWGDFTKSTQADAKELVAAVRKNANVAEAATKLGKTCVQCHDVFRIRE